MDFSLSTPVVKPVRLSLAARYDYVIFPVSYQDLRDVLTGMGFQLSTRLLGGPIGMTMEPVGTIARKDQLSVAFEPDRQIIGVAGTTLSEVTNSFFELESQVSKKIKPSLEHGTRFLEIIAQFEAESGKSPLQSIENVRKGSVAWDKFDTILGVPVAPFNVRIVSKGVDPNQEEWLDISVEPMITKANQQYVINVVCRSKKRKAVIDFAETMGVKISALLDEMERAS